MRGPNEMKFPKTIVCARSAKIRIRKSRKWIKDNPVTPTYTGWMNNGALSSLLFTEKSFCGEGKGC